MKNSHVTWILVTLTMALSATASGQNRGPYLQRGGPNEMTVVWRSATSEASAVCYGSSTGSLTNRAVGATGTQHEVRITGLAPSTRYYYSVGTFATCPPGTAGNANHYFETAPVAGATTPFRIWLVGDSGTGGTPQANVRDRMLSYVGSNRPDIFVHVGDMAYNSGTTAEFDANFFGMYPSILQNTVCWPALGNHEGASSNSSTQTGPYYDAYVLPTNGSLGGLPSNTEAYYSFDYGNMHFIVLDSFETSRAVTGPMLTWMGQDIAATSRDWVVAFWHHPPYTKGTHNSDTEIELVEMRQNALPILEANGVDMVWGGHSHIYERSFLVHGAYDTPTTAAGHIVDSGDGRLSGNGAYIADGSGAVYVVAGHGGASVGGTANHPLMYFSEVDYGSCVVDVNGDTVTLTNVRDDGALTDDFTMQRPGPLTVITPATGSQLEQGMAASITWVPGGPANVAIEYSADGGATWTLVVASTPNDGAFSWTVPTALTTQGVIRVSNPSMPAENDRSGTFSVVGALPRVVIPYGSTWEYLDNAVATPAGWQTTTGGWASGPGQLGYGDGDEATVLYDANPNVPTVYFRKALVLDRTVTAASLRVLFDDGYAVYVNGQLVADQNVANGVAHSTWASATSAENEVELTNLDLTNNPFVLGTNVIAVLVKQASATSTDVSFDLELTLTLSPVTVVDECAAGTDTCSAYAVCTDTPTGFTCACVPGYAGDGTTCLDVDECSANTDNCASSATCTNVPGSFTCACSSGYFGPGTSCTAWTTCAPGTYVTQAGTSTTDRACGSCANGTYSTAVNVAACTPFSACSPGSYVATLGTPTADQTCASCTPGTYSNTVDAAACTPFTPCGTGFLQVGGSTTSDATCVDVNECLMGTDDCSAAATCTNTVGGFTCTCLPGYSGSGTLCVDVDECAAGTHDCAQAATCTNVPGSFTCACLVGYVGDGRTCTDVDECAASPCGAGGLGCLNAPGTYTCSCGAGYVFDGTTCVVDDRCAVGNPCDVHATCVDPGVGSVQCTCASGYAGDGLTCADVDECATGAAGCGTNAGCTNAPGSYSCSCLPGYSGDGRVCVDVDECASGTDDCSAFAVCTNTPGAFDCACLPGFMGNGRACTDVDECASGTDDCSPFAVCSNALGGFTCTCGPAYSGDGRTCVRIDRCAGTNPCDPNADCIDPGTVSVQCLCRAGFAGDGYTCVDVDECAAGLDDCSVDATCTNSVGSFACACNAGYVGDGRTCTTGSDAGGVDAGGVPGDVGVDLGPADLGIDLGFVSVDGGTDSGAPPIDVGADLSVIDLDAGLGGDDGGLASVDAAGTDTGAIDAGDAGTHVTSSRGACTCRVAGGRSGTSVALPLSTILLGLALVRRRRHR